MSNHEQAVEAIKNGLERLADAVAELQKDRFMTEEERTKEMNYLYKRFAGATYEVMRDFHFL